MLLRAAYRGSQRQAKMAALHLDFLMNLSASAWYCFFRDQGSMISGLLALSAGLLAYSAGRAQVSAAERQMRETDRATVKDRVRAGLIANTQMVGITKRIQNDLRTKIAHIKFSLNQPGSTVTTDFAQSVFQVDISVVWSALGVAGHEMVDAYMRLDAELIAYKATAIHRAEWHEERLKVIEGIAANLVRQLEDDAARIQHRLAGLSDS